MAEEAWNRFTVPCKIKTEGLRVQDKAKALTRAD